LYFLKAEANMTSDSTPTRHKLRDMLHTLMSQLVHDSTQDSILLTITHHKLEP
jgi:hypothetical protein